MNPRLNNPGDKNWGVEGSLTPEQVQSILELKQLFPFLQCNGEDYKFIEFWTSNQSLILDLVVSVIPTIEV